MAGTFDRDPSPNELLKRIVELENRVSSLQQREIAPLKSGLDDLRGAFDYHLKATVAEIMRINDFLWPLVKKVFPKTASLQQQIDAIVPPCVSDYRADRDRPPKDQDKT